MDFELRQLLTAEDGIELDDYQKQYRDISELERAVARRATASRRYVPLLIGPDRDAEIGRVRQASEKEVYACRLNSGLRL